MPTKPKRKTSTKAPKVPRISINQINADSNFLTMTELDANAKWLDDAVDMEWLKSDSKYLSTPKARTRSTSARTYKSSKSAQNSARSSRMSEAPTAAFTEASQSVMENSRYGSEFEHY